jgi:hypothetical protein
MTRVQMISVLGLCLASATASADPDPPPTPPDNLLTCVNRGFGLQKCVLDTTTVLGKAIVEDGQIYEGTMLVHYDFPCTGHSVQLGVKVGDGTKFFSMGAPGALITVDGTGAVTGFDPSPEVTRTLTFNTACKLHLTNVTRTPSIPTIQIWTIQAQDQERIVNLANDRLQIAKDFENLEQYNVQNLQDLQDDLQDIHDGLDPINDAGLRHRLETAIAAIQATITGQPPSATLEEIQQAFGDAIAFLTGEVAEEVAKAQALADRFTRWELAIPPSLADSIAVANFVLEDAN